MTRTTLIYRAGLGTLVLLALVAAGSSGRATASGCSRTAPANLTLPAISGSDATGSVLTSDSGTWDGCGNVITGYTYSWSDDSGPIDGATTSSYTVSADEVGQWIAVSVTASNAVGSTTVTSAILQTSDSGDASDPTSPDQADTTGDDAPLVASAPAPMSPNGPVAAGTYTTQPWGDTATDSPGGINVVSSTASGTTALTGIVLDDSTGSTIPNATVTMTYYVDCKNCPPACLDDGTSCYVPKTPVETSTASDVTGGFAFINMPVQTYTLDITASGYGDYQVINDAYAGNQTYEYTAHLTSAAQTIDASASTTAASANQTLTAGAAAGDWYSQTRVPPTIDVGIQALNSDCSPAAQTVTATVTYPFDYYILHVAQQEVGSFSRTSGTQYYNQTGARAFFAIAQNYAWFHKTLGPPDVKNSTDDQCFRDTKVSNSAWASWLGVVLTHRVANSGGSLVVTPYASGTTFNCTDSAEPAHGGKASQDGILVHSNGECTGPAAASTRCNNTTWQSLALYYYSTSWRFLCAARAAKPSGTTYSTTATVRDSQGHVTTPGTVTFNFASVGHTSSHSFNVAWRFWIEKYTSTGWRRIQTIHWGHSTRRIAGTWTYGNATGCAKYRVRAWVPVGATLPTAYNRAANGSAQDICT